jgi:hypothetical protein
MIFLDKKNLNSKKRFFHIIYSNRWDIWALLAKHRPLVDLSDGYTDGPVNANLAQHLVDVASHPEEVGWHQYTLGLFLIFLLKMLENF